MELVDWHTRIVYLLSFRALLGRVDYYQILPVILQLIFRLTIVFSSATISAQQHKCTNLPLVRNSSFVLLAAIITFLITFKSILSASLVDHIFQFTYPVYVLLQAVFWNVYNYLFLCYIHHFVMWESPNNYTNICTLRVVE